VGADTAPKGAPIAKAQALAVRLTCSDSTTISRNATSKRPMSAIAIWKIVHPQAIEYFTAKSTPVVRARS
jgi:hypothetical protein